jgi:hypothetical protein
MNTVTSQRASKAEHSMLLFPTFASVLGGVQFVRYSARFAWVTRANGQTVRVARSKLPPVEKWTAFNLADAVRT